MTMGFPWAKAVNGMQNTTSTTINKCDNLFFMTTLL